MSAAAELARDCAGVDVALRAHADPPVVVADFLEERHRLDVLHREREVDQAFEVVVGAAELFHHLPGDREQRDAAVIDDRHRVHHRAEDAHPCQAVAVVMGARDPLRIGARLDAAARDLVGARRQVREMERAGVGQDGEIDVGGNLAGDRHAQRFDQRERHLAARGGRFIDPVDRAVNLVAGVMIDVNHRRSLEPAHAGARQVAALHDQGGIERLGNCGCDVHAVDTRERLQEQRRRRVGHHGGRFAERADRKGHRHRGADRIAVGPCMRRDHEALPAANDVEELSWRVRHS